MKNNKKNKNMISTPATGENISKPDLSSSCFAPAKGNPVLFIDEELS